MADLVRTMLEMVENDEKLAQMAEESYNMCIQKYDAYDVCEKLMNIVFAPDPQPEEEAVEDDQQAELPEELAEETAEDITEETEDTTGVEE